MTPDEQQELIRRLDWLQKRVEFIYIFALRASALGLAAAIYFFSRHYWNEQNAMWAAIAAYIGAEVLFHLGTKHGLSPGPD